MLSEVEQKFRHDNGRKCLSFEDSDYLRSIRVTPSEANELGVYDAESFDIYDPFDDLWNDHPNTFILRYRDKTYLVNTEGYDYCRYINPCVIVEDIPQE